MKYHQSLSNVLPKKTASTLVRLRSASSSVQCPMLLQHKILRSVQPHHLHHMFIVYHASTRFAMMSYLVASQTP